MLRYAAKVRQSLVSHSCPILSPFCDFKGVVVTPITPTPFLDPQLKVESMVVYFLKLFLCQILYNYKIAAFKWSLIKYIVLNYSIMYFTR